MPLAIGSRPMVPNARRMPLRWTSLATFTGDGAVRSADLVRAAPAAGGAPPGFPASGGGATGRTTGHCSTMMNPLGTFLAGGAAIEASHP
jgi:hypothetical protein